MERIEISFDLVGSELSEDIFSEEGILLLKEGTILTEANILLLKNFMYGQSIHVKKANKLPIALQAPSKVPYETSLSLVKDAFHKIVNSEEFNLVDFIKKYLQLIELSLNDVSIFEIISKEVDKEDYIYQHSINVGILSAIIGKMLGFKKKDCLLLGQMGLFHDIGMLKIDEKIIQKESSLTDEEYLEVKKHSFYGYHLLKKFSELHQFIPQATLLHHERVNGTGYPRKLKEKELPYFIQIISVADCFNAMNMKPFRKKVSQFSSVYDLINEARDNRLNPAIVIPFIKYIMRQNLYRSVKLSNGEVAKIVFIHNNEPHQPLVKLGEDNYLDLRKEASLTILHII